MRRAKLQSVHWRVPGSAGPPAPGKSVKQADHDYCGELIYRDFRANRDPLASLPFDCIAQPDVCLPRVMKHGEPLNYWPQLDFRIIDSIAEHHAGARFILTIRAIESHIDSIARWGNVRARLVEADIPGLPAGKGAKDSELRTWIEGHYAACREHFRGRDDLIELDVSHPAARERLQDFVGVPLPWWGVANKNTKRPATTSPHTADLR